jgi:2-polyprenyl-3-methyl-5-hydroxy-6-metoxy-1,4-benzoquinol methylase
VDELRPADRVLLVETIEHLTAPWDVLAFAASLVSPGGHIVVSTPHIGNLRHRLELATRGTLTSFRPANEPHLTPALGHVIRRILKAAGLTDIEEGFAGMDIIPLTGGRVWPTKLHRHFSSLCAVSIVVSARRPS